MAETPTSTPTPQTRVRAKKEKTSLELIQDIDELLKQIHDSVELEFIGKRVQQRLAAATALVGDCCGQSADQRPGS